MLRLKLIRVNKKGLSRECVNRVQISITYVWDLHSNSQDQVCHIYHLAFLQYPLRILWRPPSISSQLFKEIFVLWNSSMIITVTSHERYGVSNHRLLGLFKLSTKKISKLHIIPTSGRWVPTQRTGNVQIPWRHHETVPCYPSVVIKYRGRIA